MALERAATVLMWTVTAAVVLTLLTPLVVTLAVSISASSVFNLPPPALSLRWYERMLRLPELGPSVRLSVGIALLSTAIALVLPLSVGVVVKAFSWTILLRSDGVVNRFLVAVGALDAPVRLLFTETGLVLGAVNVFLPFMVLPIFSVVKVIDPRLLEAATTLGASPLYRFFRVTLPLTMPGVIAGVAFVFSMSVSMYVIPTLLMGDRFKTLSVLIARSFLFMRDRSLGSTVSVVLLLIAVAVVLASALLTRHWQPRR